MTDTGVKGESDVIFSSRELVRVTRHGTAALYGVGSIGTATFVIVPQLYLLFFLTDALGVPAAYASLVLLLPKAWEFFFDPLIGRWSDGLRGRGGRRVLPMLLGAPLFGIAFAFLFGPPLLHSKAIQAAAVCLIYLVATSAYTLYSVPYITVPAEMTDDRSRVRSVAWRTAFVSLGVLFAGVSAPLLVERLGGGAQGFAGMGMVLAAVATATMLAAVPAVRAMPQRPPSDCGAGLVEQLGHALRNRPFVRLWTTYLVQLVATAISLAVLPYYVKYVIRGGDYLVTLAFAVFTITSLIFLPVTAAIAGRIGQRRAYALASLVYAIGQGAILLSAGPGREVALLAAFALTGVGNAGQQLLPFAMLPRAIDYDRRITGENREGAYTGFWVAGEKLGLAAGGAVAAGVLAASGLVENAAGATAQPASAVLAIIAQLSVVPGLLFLSSLVPLAGFDRAIEQGAKR